ncbi:G-protein coupled receptor 54-like [Acanthaster planci]|uniref:G-protein coupled receptor 54-like n=1 Tax=Acanthaster planci TaxID=133434 RepID=A0A8B7YWB0_ACAPL|nr:G-protein coupled receptor 54-like [Acanthaster planci]XP_022096776.1 G-protein coupled receptor 54-like [Acanthaster planci]
MEYAAAVADTILNATLSLSPSEDLGIPGDVYPILVPLIIAVITVVGLVGNSIVVYVIVCQGHLKTVTNYYIVNLAITDISFLVCCAPFTASLYATHSWLFGQFMCKFVFYMMQVTAQATCATLTAMSIDRYYAITDPLKSLKTRTPRIAIVVSVAIWTWSALFAIPVAVYFNTVEAFFENETYYYCKEMWPYEIFFPGYAVYSFVMTYLIPLSIIAVCYVIVLSRLWKAVSPTEESHAPVHLRMLMQKRRVTRMILAVVLAFAACWVGVHIVKLWRSFDPNFPETNMAAFVFQIFSHILSYLNSCVNPFVYAFMGGNFRKQMARAFPFLMTKRNSANDGPSGSLIKSKSTQV